MKKSEAVNLLREIILEHMNCAYDCCQTDEEMYLKILNEIENKIGMLPPYSENTFDLFRGALTAHQWEREELDNEKK